MFDTPQVLLCVMSNPYFSILAGESLYYFTRVISYDPFLRHLEVRLILSIATSRALQFVRAVMIFFACFILTLREEDCLVSRASLTALCRKLSPVQNLP